LEKEKYYSSPSRKAVIPFLHLMQRSLTLLQGFNRLFAEGQDPKEMS
jgi:hypothetical protein